METSATAGSVFSLYQEGLASDQVLQLCFLRRRAPRRLRLERTYIEDEFVLPRPELKIASLLPSVDIPLDQLVASASPSSRTLSRESASPLSDTATDVVRESARRHFSQPRQAAVEDVRLWSALVESDWLQIHGSHDDTMMGLTAAAQVPDIGDVCWVLEQCPSDAFVSFVWDHLLLSLLGQCVGSNTSTHHRLFILLARHRSLASLSPKDFRAKVRARNLRQVDDAFGAQAELALVALYRRRRGDRFP
ncbi:hypothetical protein PHYPSEUDO_006903 [Phytophthora pseudosyringae]|uniref:Uncharacterized protein n=1 Tax=Phytophthora pseudosyringae TaxID=221518 RepID=A0A8T1VI14_9STRA|nr:hypothetical protein PHYPSEUDO_006903 [Phytophthora pseudosyringae]